MTGDLTRVALVVAVAFSITALVVPVTMARGFARMMAPHDPVRAAAAVRAMYPHWTDGT